MTDEAKRSRRRLTGRQRWLLWLFLFLIVTPVAGWIDARVGLWRYHSFNGCRYRGSYPLLIEHTDTGFLFRSIVPEPEPEVVCDVVLWHYHADEVLGPVCASWRIGWRSFHISRYRPEWARGVGYTEEEVEEFRQPFVEYARAHPDEFGRGRLAYIEECLKPDADINDPVWLGILGNGVFYSVFATPLLFGLWWYFRATFGSKRSRRLSRGLCPRCRYRIQGLPENRCPECGETWCDDEATRASKGET